MKDLHLLKSISVYLFKTIVKEAERKFAYTFAFFVFSATLLVSLMDKNALYVSVVGVLCLFLLKLPDIILCCKAEQKITISFDKNFFKAPLFNKKIFDKKDFNPLCVCQKQEQKDYLKTLEKLLETLEKSLFSYLKNHAHFTQLQLNEMKSALKSSDMDPFLLQTKLERYGLTPFKASMVLRICYLIKMLRGLEHFPIT